MWKWKIEDGWKIIVVLLMCDLSRPLISVFHNISKRATPVSTVKHRSYSWNLYFEKIHFITPKTARGTVDLLKNSACTSFCSIWVAQRTAKQKSALVLVMGYLCETEWKQVLNIFHLKYILNICFQLTKYTEIISCLFYQQSEMFWSPKSNYYTPEANVNVIPSKNWYTNYRKIPN